MPNIEKEPLLLPDFKKYLPKYLKKTLTAQKGMKSQPNLSKKSFEYFYIL
jgi:hypothetical protein